MTDKRKVLLTGAAGMVGSILRSHWGDRYALRLADIRPLQDLAGHEEYTPIDIAQYDQMLEACAGIDTVVHLAADPNPNAEFYSTLLPLNITGAYNAFHAAHQAGCRRLVFASSGQAILGYNTQEQESAGWDVPIFPQNVYGATKCWGEALARVYSDQHQLSCICVRLGSPVFAQDGDWDPNKVYAQISPRDTAQLFGCCVDVQDVDFAIVHGISRHQRCWMDLEISRKVVGYEPRDGTAFPRTSSQ
jgi:NAD+ dependent glucose-6-phosphate dehydrogenase